MAKGTIRGLLILSLIATICCEWNCVGHKPYKLYKVEDEGLDYSYYVCLSETSDRLFFHCPEDYNFNTETESCTLEITTEDAPTCSFAGEKFVDVAAKEVAPTGRAEPRDEGGNGEEGNGEEGNGEEGNGEDGEDETCTSYWLCDENLVASQTECPAGDLFNTLLLECVSSKYWTCAEGSPDCESPNYQNKKWTNKKDCGTFYECIGNIPTKRKCPAGYYFNATGQGCLHNVNEQCKVPTDWAPAPLVDLENMCKGNVGKFLPDPNYCKGYYYCVSEDTPYWKACDNDLYFDNGNCVSKAPSTCKCETVNWKEVPSGKISIPSSDPKKYYYCVKGKVGVEITCPEGMVFDEEEGMCSE
ncbi:unnamed protein product [Hermetia illucens]|uniref:Chitin-binding type-2 domain-containing protein n=1 Tax=Hermetia illucens TaxID=343691 RepID=A0A7R8UGS3_HERIL|nr:uncharacterized protein LOC119649641 isoform X2 [Hermetia illucens]CAD7080582.1 unnamed protein product [Hermetia illucens]